MEIYEIIGAVKQNDDLAFDTLLEQFKKMIFSIINDYNMEYGDYQISKDDLYQEACIALYEAALSFDEKRNVKFSTFAYVVIKRRVFRFYKVYKSEYELGSYSLDNIECLDHKEEFKNTTVGEDPVEYYRTNQLYEKIRSDNKTINQEDKIILLMRINNYSYDEISRKLNIKKKRIDNRLMRLKKRYLKNDKE